MHRGVLSNMSKHPAPEAELLAVSLAASIAGVSVDTLKRWERAGRITSVRTPTNHRRYRRADVEALLTAERSEASA